MQKGLRFEIYRRLTNIFPSAWKIFRVLLYGRYNFNDPKVWDDEYSVDNNDEIEDLNNRIPNLIDEVVSISDKFDSILEVSAGFGNFIGKVGGKKRLEATELSDKAIRHLQSEGIPTKKARLPNLPYEDEAFECVISISVFEHLKSEEVIRSSFQECHRVCGSCFVLSVPYNCMEPHKNLIHNYDFKYEDVKKFSDGLFKIDDFGVVRDNVTERAIYVLSKI